MKLRKLNEAPGSLNEAPESSNLIVFLFISAVLAMLRPKNNRNVREAIGSHLFL